MIVFDLRCTGGHVFEAWFGSSSDYESQRGRGLVSCPICGDAEVTKAPMAPAVPAKGNAKTHPNFNANTDANASAPVAAEPAAAAAPPGAIKQMLAAMAEIQKKIVAQSEHVGPRFAEEARAIHHGEAEARSIYGACSPAEAETLRDEGIDVAPLPFPVADPAKAN